MCSEATYRRTSLMRCPSVRPRPATRPILKLEGFKTSHVCFFFSATCPIHKLQGSTAHLRVTHFTNSYLDTSAGSIPLFWYRFDTEYDTKTYQVDTEYSLYGAHRPVCQYVFAVEDQTRMKPACQTSKRKYFREQKQIGRDFASKTKIKMKKE